MDEILAIVQNLGKELTAIDIAVIWLLWKINVRLFGPLRQLIETITVELRNGHLTHRGIVEELKTMNRPKADNPPRASSSP